MTYGGAHLKKDRGNVPGLQITNFKMSDGAPVAIEAGGDATVHAETTAPTYTNSSRVVSATWCATTAISFAGEEADLTDGARRAVLSRLTRRDPTPDPTLTRRVTTSPLFLRNS